MKMGCKHVPLKMPTPGVYRAEQSKPDWIMCRLNDLDSGQEAINRDFLQGCPLSEGYFRGPLPSTTSVADPGREHAGPNRAKAVRAAGATVLGFSHLNQSRGGWWSTRAAGVTAKRSTSGCGEDSSKRSKSQVASHRSQVAGRRPRRAAMDTLPVAVLPQRFAARSAGQGECDLRAGGAGWQAKRGATTGGALQGRSKQKVHRGERRGHYQRAIAGGILYIRNSTVRPNLPEQDGEQDGNGLSLACAPRNALVVWTEWTPWTPWTQVDAG